MASTPKALRKWLRAIGAILLSAGACNSAFAADITFHRSLAASGPVALKVCTNSGTVVVTGAEGNNVEIAAKIHNTKWSAFGNTDQMKKIAADPPVMQTGNAVQVGNQDTCGRHLLQNISIDYVISIPKTSSVVVNSGSGDIQVATIQSFVRAVTGSGSIKATDIGPASRLETGSGTVDIQSAHGDVKASSGSGDLAIRDSDLTEARLQAGSGNITATNLHGGLRANTGSGSIILSGSPESDWKLETGAGNIHCHMAANSKFTLDAETGSGTIHSKLSGATSGHGTKGVLRGPINGGGPIVKISTGSGNIDIE